MNAIFHISDCADIEVFTPQAFWHVNYVWSGKVTPSRPMPAGATIFHVVYCDTADKIPFYYLPRLTPRIWLTKAVSGGNIRTVSGLVDTSGSYRALLVPANAKATIQPHRFYTYSFDAENFERLPTGEWVCYEPVKPIAVSGPHDAIESLAADGVQLIYHPDLPELKKRLDAESITHHCEKV